MRTKFFLLFFIFFSSHLLKAQIVEYGLNLNYHLNKLIVKNEWANDIFLREATAGSGYGFGLYFFQREPKDYNKRGLDLKYGFLADMDACICKSNLNIAITRPNGLPRLSDLSYKMYRIDISPKLTIHQRRIGIGLGPKISRLTYVGYTTNKSDDTFSATSDFFTMSYGAEAVFFYDAGGVKLSFKYNRQLTTFQKAIVRRPTEIGNRQLLFTLSFRIIDKSKGLNHDSIIWN